jgi:D-amino-acid oxidase
MVTSREHGVLVIGAGVSGLTSAICLAEAGYRVRILTAERPQRTTSAKAGASWGPYLVSDERILRWSTVTRTVLERIALQEPSAGIRLVPGIEAAPVSIDPPGWAYSVHGFRQCKTDELPDGYLSGWEYTIPLVDMPGYLAYLERRAAEAGVAIDTYAVGSLDELRGQAAVTVNCAGLGAQNLVNDVELFPTAGQIVLVENQGIERFFQDITDGEELTYVIPHKDYVVLGGSAMSGLTDLTIDPDVAAGIIKRCTHVEPRVRDAPVIGHRIGLRPTRATVRLEREDRDGHTMIHNYGHGGAGVTLSWGCARDVQALVESA